MAVAAFVTRAEAAPFSGAAFFVAAALSSAAPVPAVPPASVAPVTFLAAFSTDITSAAFYAFLPPPVTCSPTAE